MTLGDWGRDWFPFTLFFILLDSRYLVNTTFSLFVFFFFGIIRYLHYQLYYLSQKETN